MLQVARLAPNVLGEAAPLVADFLESQRHPDGGFLNRNDESDLYYTVFGMECLLALRQPLPWADLHRYITQFGTGDDLDFVHLTCLARCWSILPAEFRSQRPTQAMLGRIEACRTLDGGYDTSAGQSSGTLYGSFLAVGAYQDVQQPIPDPQRLAQFLHGLREPREGYRQSRALPISLTPATAGAIALLRMLDEAPADEALGRWLLSCFDPQGGFRPSPAALVPDLLSTATALHALAALKVELGALKEPCLDFLDTLWTNRGGFYGHWEDTHVDCEYTYYGLVSLGHLSL